MAWRRRFYLSPPVSAWKKGRGPRSGERSHRRQTVTGCPSTIVPAGGTRIMRTAVFSTKSYDREFLSAANQPIANQPPLHELVFLEPRLTAETVKLAEGFPAICAFVNDQLGEPVLAALAGGGTRLVALRSAGFNHVDLAAAARLRLTVVRVPAYSPYAVAEHTVGPDPGTEPQAAQIVRPGPRGQLLAGESAGLRPARADGGHHRHRQDRRRSWPGFCTDSAADCWCMTCTRMRT